MEKITASEASNDEMERMKFAKWFEGKHRDEISNLPIHEQVSQSKMAWEGWQAALKSKQGEV